MTSSKQVKGNESGSAAFMRIKINPVAIITESNLIFGLNIIVVAHYSILMISIGGNRGLWIAILLGWSSWILGRFYQHFNEK